MLANVKRTWPVIFRVTKGKCQPQRRGRAGGWSGAGGTWENLVLLGMWFSFT